MWVVERVIHLYSFSFMLHWVSETNITNGSIKWLNEPIYFIQVTEKPFGIQFSYTNIYIRSLFRRSIIILSKLIICSVFFRKGFFFKSRQCITMVVFILSPTILIYHKLVIYCCCSCYLSSKFQKLTFC